MPDESKSVLARAHVDRGIGHFQRGEFAAAIAVAGLALRDDPKMVAALLLRGRALARSNRRVEALNDLDAAARLAPSNSEVLAERGALHIACGRPNQAMADFNAAIRAGGAHAGHYFRRGAALFNLADYAAAEADFSKAMDKQRSSQALYYRGLCRRQLSKFDDALADFTAALELDAKFVNGVRERAKLHSSLGRYQHAIDDCTRWLELSPDDAEAHSVRGEVHHRLGDEALCLEDYRAAVRCKPADAKAANRLAWVLATAIDPSLRNGEEAKALAERAVSLSRSMDPIILDTLAAARATCGDFDAAIQAIDEAMLHALPELQSELARHRERLISRQTIEGQRPKS